MSLASRPPAAIATEGRTDLSAARVRIAKQLESSLPLMKRAPNTFHHVSDVAASYSDSYNILQERRQDLDKFLADLVHDASPTINLKESDSMGHLIRGHRQQFVDDLLDRISLPTIPVAPCLQAELFRESAATAAVRLQRDLRDALNELMRATFDSLLELADERIVGTIDWPIPDACRFRFYEHELSESNVNYYNGSPADASFTRTALHSLDRTEHQQQLANAQRHALCRYAEPIPVRVRRYLADLPYWLHNEIEIVDGDLFRKDSVDVNLFVESSVYYHRDPAVTLGNYFILATWECEENQAETAARDRRKIQHAENLDRNRQAAGAACRDLLLLSLGLQLIPMLLLLFGGSIAPLRFVAVGWALATLVIIPKALQKYACFRHKAPDAAFYASGVFGAALILLSFYAGLFAVFLQGELILLSALLAVAGSFTLSFAAQHLRALPKLPAVG